MLWLGAVAGCGTATRPHNIQNVANYYHVHRGDTLHTIAWRFNLDVRDLVAWNRLKPPYTIYPHQRLVLSPPPGYTPPVAKKHTRPRQTVVARPTITPPRQAQPAKPQLPTHPARGVAMQQPPKRQTPDGGNKTKVAKAVSAEKGSKPRKLRWRWPLNGQLVQRYNATIPGHQGIRIQGRNGQAVVATEAGTVVYSGNGLKGYREMIIIQHSPAFLSAYAQNRKRLVSEGDKVRRGQKIAELGDPHTNAPELHFELRLDGKPVDPLAYLGSR